MYPASDSGSEAFRRHISLVFGGALALAVGSLMLLIGAIVWLWGGGEGAFVLRFPALVIHFIGWMLLLASMKGVLFSRHPDDRRLVVRMTTAWALSVLAAFVGIASLPWALPQEICSIICFPLGFRLLVAGYFPFVPSVFAPVVACHGAFFLLESRCHGPPAADRLRNAALILFGLAAASIAVQAAGWFFGPAYLLAGLTAGGYLLTVAGLYGPLRTPPAVIGYVPAVSHPEGL